MRECLRCKTQMKEDCDLRSGSNYKLTLTKSTKNLFPGAIDFIKVAVCPKCGEISIYVDQSKIKD